MSKILAVALHASDDPTKASLPFITAVGAIGADRPCTIALVGEAVSLVKEAVAKNIHGVGFPPLTELLAKIKDKVPVFVWGACSVARGVTEADLKALNASFMDPIKFANLIAESNVVSFWSIRSLPEAAATHSVDSRCLPGTAPDMSPERARGRMVDKRTDGRDLSALRARRLLSPQEPARAQVVDDRQRCVGDDEVGRRDASGVLLHLTRSPVLAGSSTVGCWQRLVRASPIRSREVAEDPGPARGGTRMSECFLN
jgi:predicted peroxiredoxin